MACPSCARKKKGDGYTHYDALHNPPFNANDVQICDNGEVRRLGANDWPENRHKLVLFFTDIENPGCQGFDRLRDWVSELDKLDCDLFLASAEQVHILKDFIDSDPSFKDSGVKALSSYLLPTRLNILHNGKSMQASVFITKEADVIVQHHFSNVSRSLSELHRMLYGYVANSRCTHEWADPSANFVGTEKNDGAEKS